MDFTSDYILENERARLEPLTAVHLPELLPYALAEPEIWTYSLVSSAGEENLAAAIQQAETSRQLEQGYAFAIFDKVSEKYAGTTRFYEISVPQRTLSIGYTWYGKAHQGTGLNKHCKYLLLEFAFEKLGFERVEFRADARNARSITAMKSIGAVEEGILRSNGCAGDGSRRDSIVLSILRSEWIEHVKQHLENKLDK